MCITICKCYCRSFISRDMFARQNGRNVDIKCAGPCPWLHHHPPHPSMDVGELFLFYLLWKTISLLLKQLMTSVRFPDSNDICHFPCNSKPVNPSSWMLTLALCQQLLWHEAILSVAQNKSQKGEDESVQDAHNSQDVSPTYRASPQAVFVRLLAAHPADRIAVPTVRIDHAAEHQTDTWWEAEEGTATIRRNNRKFQWMRSSKIITFLLGKARQKNNLQPICLPLWRVWLWCIDTKTTSKQRCVYYTVITCAEKKTMG